MKQIKQIGDTPLSISVYSVEQMPTVVHDEGILEIIFCLKGSVKLFYVYDEFLLEEGDFISVDKEAYYLYDGKDNICVSLYFDLKRYQDKYPYINNALFACEECKNERDNYPREYLNQVKGLMISLLKHIIESDDQTFVEEASEKIIDIFLYHFNILCYLSQNPELDMEIVENLQRVWDYIWRNLKGKITLTDLAEQLDFTTGYMSEYLRKNAISYRGTLGYIRANASERLLIKTDKNILEISEECGFSDVKYYYSAFKKWFRSTPKHYRDRHRKMVKEKLVNLELDDIAGIIDKMLVNHYKETFLR